MSSTMLIKFDIGTNNVSSIITAARGPKSNHLKNQNLSLSSELSFLVSSLISFILP